MEVKEGTMKGIAYPFGTIFVTDGRYTLRKTKRTDWQISPVSFSSIEWDLRTEPPDTWTYLTEEEIKDIPDGGYEKILALFEDIYAKRDKKRK